MSGTGSDPDPLGPLADDFLERYRRGERPAPTEYAARHPELAQQIREVFPALMLMEDVRPEPQTAAEHGGSKAPPRRLGDYRIVREIGRGGMGVVYEAEQESLGRRVALKVLPAEALRDAKHIERFQREARAAARLHHTNIVPVFGVGEDNGTPYYVMQYIEGRPLDEVLAELRKLRDEGDVSTDPGTEVVAADSARAKQAPAPSGATMARSLWRDKFRHAPQSDSEKMTDAPSSLPKDEGGRMNDEGRKRPELTNSSFILPPSSFGPRNDGGSGPAPSSSVLSDPRCPFATRVAQLGIQVAEALEYAAGQGVLHRDIKPANLLLDVWGTVWLTDFGLAKATGTPDLTRPGDLVGTLRYLAPERFEGRFDVRSDVYALGLTLYEMLVLQPAFGDREEAELVQHITKAEARRLDQIDPRLPRDLVTIVHKAMAREPRDRYQTAEAMAEDLRRFLDNRHILARRVGLPERAWRWCRRNPAMATLLAAIFVLLLVLMGGALRFERHQAERRAEVAHRQGLARQAVEEALERTDPRGVKSRWLEALAILEQAESRLDEADSEDLRGQLEQTRSDLKLASRLEKIRMDRAAFVAGEFATATADRDYAAAFAEAGLAPSSSETAERIRQSAIREQLVAAVDDWAVETSNGPLRWLLMRLASQADADPRWRDRLPGPLVWNKEAERTALERLAKEAPIGKLSPQFVTLLGVRLRRAGADPEPLLRSAQRLHPADFWINYDLGVALLRSFKPADAVGFFRAALVARPDCSHIYDKLGLALIKLDRSEEAIAAYRRAIELDPKYSAAHFNLAQALYDRKQVPEAIAEYRRAIETDSLSAVYSHNKLGMVLEGRGQAKEAMAEYRRAIACNPKEAPPHYNLGRLLAADGQTGDAIAEFHRAIELDPESAAAHFELGRCLRILGRLDQAMAEFRRVIELEPNHSAAHHNLGVGYQAEGRVNEAIAEFRKAALADPKGAPAHDDLSAALLRKGLFVEARAAAQRGLDLVAPSEPRHKALRQTLEQCDRMLALDAQLPAILKGKEHLTDAKELLAQARVYREFGRPYTAVRLYSAAFEARPELAKDVDSRNRFAAACAAARAITDPCPDEPRLEETERTMLRHQALDWLRAELEQWTNRRSGDEAVRRALKPWLTDAALVAFRDPASLDKLPADECDQWRRLWEKVDALLALDPLEQGRAQAARREWNQAVDSYRRAEKLKPADEGHFWFEYAAVLLLSGNQQAYAKACARMVEVAAATGQSSELRPYHIARACTLAPDSVADPALPGGLAKKELDEDARQFWSLTEQGALHYRANRFSEAVTFFEKSLRADPMTGRAVVNWSWLALANYRLGKAEEARRWLDKAQSLLAQYGDGLPNGAEKKSGLHLHNWLEAHILIREAEALIRASSVNSSQSDTATSPKK